MSNSSDNNHWQCMSQLGSGGFGIVHVWRNSVTGQCYALKKCKLGSDITMTARHKEAWVREVDIMQRLDHPGVVSCVPTPPGLDQGDTDLPTLCMEFCEAGDLRRELNKVESCRGLPQNQVLEILNDVVSALGYLHNRRIIHRDLKPENVVMKGTEARTVYKLIDLGYAKELGVSSLARSFVGTLQYVAPELFQEHDYTKSVDYWSLGLLCHEIVTGQRPFLPNMSPGQWIDYVECKKYEDISVIQDIQGEVKYLKNLNKDTLVCPPLARMLEEWLRSLLDWNSSSRGRDGDDNIIVFTKLNSILTQRWISVFCTALGKTLHFSVHQHPTVQTLLVSLSNTLGTSSTDTLMLLTKTGTRLKTTDGTESVIVDKNTAQPDIFLYNIGAHSLNKIVNIPDLVKVALTDTKRSLQDYHQKIMFVQGFHFINEHFENMKHLIFSIKLLKSYLSSKLEAVSELAKRMVPDKEKMETKYEMYKECFQVDLSRYHQQAEKRDRITSTKMVTNWVKTNEDLANNVQEVISRISIVLDTIEEETKNLQNTGSEIIKVPDQDLELQNLVTKSLSLYNLLKKERPAKRQDDTPKLIAQTVVRMLKRRDVLIQELHGHLLTLSQFIRSVLDLELATSLLLEDIRQTSNNIYKSQIRRQNDIWALLAAAVQQRSSTSSSNREDLRADIEQSIEATNKVVDENIQLRTEFAKNLLD